MYGRERELAVLHDLADRLAGSTGGALVVRGEAGIGKSSLLAAIIEQVQDRGVQVFSAVGVQSETRLPFAGLHQLLRPILHLVGGLPPRQRAALLVAFGMFDEVAPELFLVALATLELIGETAQGSPVLLVIEAAHWLDQPSSAALAIVSSRSLFRLILGREHLRTGLAVVARPVNATVHHFSSWLLAPVGAVPCGARCGRSFRLPKSRPWLETQPRFP